MLHHKHKLKYFEQAGWEDEWIEKAEDLVRTVFEKSYKYLDFDFLAPTLTTVIGHENAHAPMSAFLAIISAIFTKLLQLKWSKTNNCI